MIFKGYWYLPENKEKKIAGILTIKTHNLYVLELIGGFEESIEEILEFENKEVIFGEAYDSNNKIRKISLINCQSFRPNVNLSANYPLTSYKCSVIIDGIHIDSLDSNNFIELKANLSSLFLWKKSNIIKQTIHFSEDSIDTKQINNLDIRINSNDNWEIPIEIEKSTKVILCSNANLKSKPYNKGFIVNQNTEVKIKTKYSTSLNYLYNKLNLFKQFLSFATLDTVCVHQLIAYSKEYYQEVNNRKIFNPIYIYLINKDFCEKDFVINKTNFLFYFSDIKEEYDEIIKKWFEVSDEIAPIRQHLINSINSTNEFTSISFLIVAQALEGFHRRFMYPEKKDLRERLNELINKFSNIDKVKTISEIEVDQTVKSRHYYSHFFKKDKKVLEGIKLYYFTSSLKKLLICCVLDLVGFKHEKINHLLNKNMFI